MTTEETLKTKLESLTGRTVYVLRLPEGVALPAISYRRISNRTELSHSGNSMSFSRYEINCWASEYPTSLSDANNIIAGLNGNKSDFKTSYQVNSMDVFEDDTGLFRTIVEVMVLN
jgi:hypothetical protein